MKKLVRKLVGIYLIATAVLLTMANSAGPETYYERELLKGDRVIVQNAYWEDATGCLPPVVLKEPAMKVTIIGSKGNKMASMVCDFGTNCIDKVTSFKECIANMSLDNCSEDTDTEQAQSTVSCATDKQAAAETGSCEENDFFGNFGDIKKCNDEMTIRVEHQDGSVAKATFRQLYAEEHMGDYGCNYPG